MDFKKSHREFQEIARELSSVRRHNLSFSQYDASMLLMAEGVLVLLALERFLRMVLGPEASSTDNLRTLLQKATSEELNLIRLPGSDTERTINDIENISGALSHADYERAAHLSGKDHKDEYFKSSRYIADVETLYRVLNRIVKQIDITTGKPIDRSRVDMKEFLSSPDFLDLSRPALDERGSGPQEPRDRRYMLADEPGLAFSLPHWEEAMLSCFHFEIHVRLLVGKFDAGRSVTDEIGDKKHKTGLLTMLFERPKLAFTVAEKTFLPKCNTLRNKLIHCEPDAVRHLVRELIPDFCPPDVVSKLPVGIDGISILEALTDRKGAVPVSSTSSRHDGFFGWMLQASNDGTFDRASGILRYGIGILKAKAWINDN